VRIVQYRGRRDPRFVAIHRGGLLALSQHRLLVNWAADCAEHVLHLFTSKYLQDDRPRKAIEIARAWSKGEATVQEAREMAFASHAAAREASDPAARAAARAAGHAVATAHMAGHELGAAAYAIKTIRLASTTSDAVMAGEEECRWQRKQLPESIRELVLSDEVQRDQKFWLVFSC
jgi:hypothetical protein